MYESPLSPEDKIKNLNRRYGLAYGMVAGLAYAAALWGYDGFLLSQAHAYFPWVKLAAGGLLSMLAGGAAGWLTARFEKSLLGVFFWAGASGLLAWFTLIVPFVLAPFLMKILAPDLRSLLVYDTYADMTTRIGVAYAWVLIAGIVTGVIQIPTVDQAVFSINLFSKLTPFLLCAFLMLISGAVIDSMNNQPARNAVINLDRTIQFTLDHRGEEIDKKVAREMHLLSLRTVQDTVQDTRRLVMTSYDLYLEIIHVAVNFDGQWVDCMTIVGNPINCETISP